MESFSISIKDNDSYMCSSADRVFEGMNGLEVCPSCSYRTNYEYINPDFKLKRKREDLSGTYDGYYIASKKLKDLLIQNNISGVDFVSLKNEPDHFVMLVRNKVSFDSAARKTKFLGECDSCSYYESITGATPAFLKEPLSSMLCCSDIMFGSGNSKHPLLLVTEEFVQLIKNSGVKGIAFKQTRT